MEKQALGTAVCTMRGVCKSSYKVVMRFHLKLAKGRGFTVTGEREAMRQVARNLSTSKREL